MKRLLIVLIGIFGLAACDEETNENAEKLDETKHQEEAVETNEAEESRQAETDNPEDISDSNETNDAESVEIAPVIIEETLWHFDEGEAYDVQAEVGPIIQDGEYAILPMVLDTTSDIEVQFRKNIFNNGFVSEDPSSGFDIRLIDAEQMTVSHMGVLSYDKDWGDGQSRKPLETFLREGSLNNRMRMGPDHEPVRYFAIFQKTESDSVHVLLQSLGLAEDVPVVDREDVNPPNLAEAEQTEDTAERDNRHTLGVPTLEEIVQRELTSSAFEEVKDSYPEQIVTRVIPLETYRESMETAVSRIDTIEHSTLILSGDVLFEFDSADLTDDANEEFEGAIIELEGVEGGELEIVGHTDNEGSDDYNQNLSEDRAKAVQDRLKELTDLDAFDDISVEGKSFHEPITDNDTEAGRSQNRRVELHFTPPAEEIVIEQELDLSEAPGAEAKHPDAVEVEAGKVEVLSLTQVDSLLVGRIRVQANEGELDRNALRTYGSGATSLAGARGMHFQESIGYLGSTVYNITLLHGDQRYYPIDYYLTPLPESHGEQQLEEEDGEYIVPLAERFLQSSYNSDNDDAYFMATVIWPAVDADKAAVELGLPSINTTTGDIDTEVDKVQPWRITNIPLEHSEQTVNE
ncbi:OmpA family protein [Gracilibacillus sp. S3-1-1]|uniref:OmpA family protein n=1 Tax=Gracilibacillus pellucidus TaxID=3095368 RepID=A0ACC6M6C8_9BACI|nr:OmpA family protein [Gracilibacillus sp. S3-1-1]MDX8046524.1 OmpA family protein [Gracilibacillus sp. S3-1-1]